MIANHVTRVLITCFSDTACEQYPDHPCWYEVCDNYDLCNEALRNKILYPLLLLLLLVAINTC